MPESAIEIIVPRAASTQPVRAIYSDTAKHVLDELGDVVTRRASHVEPTEELPDIAVSQLAATYAPGISEISAQRAALPRGWWASLLPSNGPILGPFVSRDDAINAELVWLKQHNYPVCVTCARATYTPQIQPPLAEPRELGN